MRAAIPISLRYGHGSRGRNSVARSGRKRGSKRPATGAAPLGLTFRLRRPEVGLRAYRRRWETAMRSGDAFLKPIFLGRGVEIPMLVILIGAIGGLVRSGVIGLFVGAVVLAIGYGMLRPG